MSRNGSGTYTLPSGNPVVTGTTISSTWANNTLTDIANGLTQSVAADGQTPITGPLIGTNGTVVFGGVGQTQIPSGTTAQRSSTPTTGMIRYNTDLNAYEGYSGTDWVTVSSANANSIVYNEGGTGAVDQTVESKLQQIISVKDFGAKGDGTTNDTVAFQNASAYITSLGGGKLIIPQGTYIVGSQTFAGATGLGYSYLGANIITIQNCTKPVEIEAQGAVLKLASGLKYGSFNPVTGVSYSPTLPFYNTDYQASLGNVFNIKTNVQVKIYGALEIDGNQAGMTIGGGWGDTGIQIVANGMYLSANGLLNVDGAYIHHNCADGIQLLFTSIAEGNTARPTLLSNLNVQYNGRNGLSWVGGIGLTVINSIFSNQGQGTISSAPTAGIDIEAESAVCRQGTFINCEMARNKGLGMSADSGDSADMTFISCIWYGTDYYCMKPNKPRYKFISCTFAGTVFGLYSATTYNNATLFDACLFTQDLTYNGYNTFYPSRNCIDFASAIAIINNCSFVSTIYASNKIGSSASSQCRFTNCTFTQSAAGTSTNTIQGQFYGGNVFTFTTGGANDFSGSTFFGVNKYTGTIYSAFFDSNGIITQTQAPVISLEVFGDNGGTGAYYRTVYLLAAPSTGAWVKGDRTINSNPAVGSPKSWVCTVAGTPGTWVSEGNL